ncbi:MAG: type IV pilus modification PilV family protein [Planctomycetota bacterium]|jgi:prepilin-type N-terminal cleavage/methylation domain-containing protein
MRRDKKQHGFTLLEATMAMVLLSIAAAGVLLPFANAASVQAEGARQTLSATLASELMEKVLATDYSNVIATWHGYAEADGSLLDTSGGTHSGSAYDGFSRSVSCQAAAVASVDLIAATVTVSYQGVQMTRATTLMGNHD